MGRGRKQIFSGRLYEFVLRAKSCGTMLGGTMRCVGDDYHELSRTNSTISPYLQASILARARYDLIRFTNKYGKMVK
jgi:hypothetical protein